MLTTPRVDVTLFLPSAGATLIATIQDAALMGVIAVKTRARHLTTIVWTLFLIVLTLLYRPNIVQPAVIQDGLVTGQFLYCNLVCLP
jgi:hypothetical protein